MTDFDAILLDPIYAAHPQATDAVLDLGSDGTVALRVLDKTSGVETGDGVTVSSVKPAAAVRASELASRSVTRTEFNGTYITFNGTTWQIVSNLPKPGLAGESTGEVYLILEAA